MINEDFSLIAYCYKGFFDTASAHAQGLDSLRGRLFDCGKFLFTKETLDK